MFKSFYGLTFNPFDKSIAENHAFKSNDHEQMLSRLDYLKNTRGIGLFTAPPGMGKTFTLRCFAQNLKSKPLSAFVHMPFNSQCY